MKARYFRKLRAKNRYYRVEHSDSLFGSFSLFEDNPGIVVLAKNTRHACERARKRGYGLNHKIQDWAPNEAWAKWKVKREGASDNFRNISYY